MGSNFHRISAEFSAEHRRRPRKKIIAIRSIYLRSASDENIAFWKRMNGPKLDGPEAFWFRALFSQTNRETIEKSDRKLKKIEGVKILNQTRIRK